MQLNKTLKVTTFSFKKRQELQSNIVVINIRTYTEIQRKQEKIATSTLLYLIERTCGNHSGDGRNLLS